MKRIFYFVLSCLLCPALAFADGGTLRLSQRLGEYQVSVFTSPAVLRAGPVDVSVLVQDAASGQVRDDVPVSVRLQLADQPATVLEQPASTSAATNKLFRAALFDLSRPGVWQAKIDVGDSAAKETSPLTFNFEVAPPPPAWLQLAPWVGWPLGLVALFVWHQRLATWREPGTKPSARWADRAR